MCSRTKSNRRSNGGTDGRPDACSIRASNSRPYGGADRDSNRRSDGRSDCTTQRNSGSRGDGPSVPASRDGPWHG